MERLHYNHFMKLNIYYIMGFISSPSLEFRIRIPVKRNSLNVTLFMYMHFSQIVFCRLASKVENLSHNDIHAERIRLEEVSI